MSPPQTCIPAVLDRLLEMLTGDEYLKDDVQILDGPTKSGEFKGTVLLLGYQPSAQVDVAVLRAEDELNQRAAENFTIGWLIASVNADGKVSASRARAGAVYDALVRVVSTEDKTLGSVAHRVQIGPTVTWRAVPITTGVQTEISGTITGTGL